jgi:hypothetical protein
VTVAIDASSPSLQAGLSNSLTTSAFNPPDNSVLVAVVIRSTGTTISTNGTALTWTSRKEDTDSGNIEIFTAPLVTGRTGMTVTASGATTGELALKVYVITGGDLSNPVGATGSGTSTANAPNVTGYTSTVAGSRGICGAFDQSARGLPTSTDDEAGYNLFSSGMSVAKAANTTPAGTAVTFNLDAGGTSTGNWYWIAVEILPLAAVPATATPSDVAAAAAVPAPTLSTGSTVTPSPVAAVAAVPDPGVSGGATATPGAVAATTTVPSPVIATGGNITIAVDTIAAVASVLTPTVLAGTTATPDAVAAVATVPLPHIQLPEHVNVAPAPLAVVVAVPPPVISTPILPGANITRPGQLEYDGFVIGSGTPYRMIGLAGFDDLPNADSGNSAEPADHGSRPGRTLARDRVLTWTGFIDCPPEQFEAARNALVNATPYPRGAEDLPIAVRVLSTTYLVYGKIAPGGRIISMGKGYRLGYAPVALQFLCADPRIYGITIRTADLANGGTISVLNTGNTETRPSFRIPGPAVNPTLRVVDTGRTMRFGINLAAGEYIDVDCRAGSALWMGEVNVLAALANSTSVPPHLFEFLPGTSQVTYSATGGSVPVINVLWRDATQ